MAEENPTKKIRKRGSASIPSSGVRTRAQSLREKGNSESKGNLCSEALSNHLVLQSIFSNLDNHDLQSCCGVNTTWCSMAEGLVARCFDVKLMEKRNRFCPLYRSDSPMEVIITKLATHNSEQVSYPRCNVEKARNLLEEAMGTGKIQIHLDIMLEYVYENGVEDTFLSKFGELVGELCVGHTIFQMSILVAMKHCPNLKRLDLTGTCVSEDEDFDAIDYGMENLKRLYNFDSDYWNEDITPLKILRMAPNLEEIYDFPILALESLVDSGKASCLKSVDYPQFPAECFQPVLEKLANLEVKLKSFSLDFSDLESVINTRAVMPIGQRILQSSRYSLEKLDLHKTESLDFKSIGPLASLMKIQFSVKVGKNPVLPFFAPDIVLRDLFPNVYSVIIIDVKEKAHITGCFSQSQFSPWGTQIEKLMLSDVTVEALQELKKIFPSVKCLKFHVKGIKMMELRSLLATVGENWPELEDLIVVDIERKARKYLKQQCSIDSVFTGFPDSIIAQLQINKFFPKEVKKFKARSTMRKFTKLKSLKFKLDNRGNTFLKQMADVTPLSKEFGFQFLPELTIVVRTHRIEKCKAVSQIKSKYPSLVNFRVERLVKH